MADRKKKVMAYTLSDHALKLIDFVADKTLVPKSRLVEKAVVEHYADYLKELEAKKDGETVGR